MIVFTIFVFFKVPETKHKTVEEIAGLFQPGGPIEVEEIMDDVFPGNGVGTGGELSEDDVTEADNLVSRDKKKERSMERVAEPDDVKVNFNKDEEKKHLTKSEENVCQVPV